MPHLNLPVELPPCGTLVGTGIMNSKAGYLVGSGKMHTTWVSQLFTPRELLDKILEDNQGNFVQYWGFSGGLGPVTFARHHALEDLGMSPPEPDWKNGRNLVVKDWVNPQDYHERSGAGVLKLIKAAAEKGLYIALLYTESHSQWSNQFLEAGGKFYLGYDFGERFSFRFDESHRRSVDFSEITLKMLADDLVERVAAHVNERHANGWGNVAATSGNFYLDYEIAAGADVPMTEDFGCDLNISSALSRGLYRQYALPIWGSHLAHEHYSWIPYSSEFKFPLLRAAMFIKYLAGCKMILNESGGWYLEAALVTDSPLFETPRVLPGHHKLRDPYLGAPFVEEASKTFHKINYHSPTAQAYRREISNFYDFVKEEGTPAGQPESTLAVIKGQFDLGGSGFEPNGVVAGMHDLAEENPRWFSAQPERGWDIVKKVFFPNPPVMDPWPNRFLSGTPYGQIDITSFAQDQVDADFLSANYKALLFAGWNTASEKQYRELCRYVKNGGILFLSIPHLSTNVMRNYSSFGVEELVHGGDFSELCGLKVKARGKRFYWATAPDDQGELGFKFPRRFGILSVRMGDIEITDPAMEVLATDDEDFLPVLLRRRLGKGQVYFLNTWAYPGATDQDFGPGAERNSPGLTGYVYRHIARQVRGTVWITDDQVEPGPECNFVSYSYYPEDDTICLLNIDFKNPHRIFVHRSGRSEPVDLAPRGVSNPLNKILISMTRPKPTRSKYALRLLGFAGCLVLTVSPASAQQQGLTVDSGSGPIRKKLVNRGWGAPTVEELRDNIKLIEASPFDGTAIRLYVMDHEGKSVAVFGAGVNRPWKKEWFQPAIEILKSIKSPVVKESFISVSLAVPETQFADAFDDEAWENIVEHFRIMAWAAKQAGLKGIMLDLEAYSSTVVKFRSGTQKDKTFDEYAAKVRQRGRELMTAMAKEYPDMTLFTLFLNSGFAMGGWGGDPRDALLGLKNNYGLMPAFINGWLDAVPPQMTIVDGMEHSYPHSTEIAYLRRVNAARNTGIAFVAEENRPKFRAQVQAGLAIYMDAFLNHRKDVHSDVYTDPPLEGPLVDRLRQATMSALDAVDEYVWVFDEQHRFWPTSNSRVDELYWDDFIPGAAAALKEAKDPARRQIANAEREFAISEHKAGIRDIPLRNLVQDAEINSVVKKKGEAPIAVAEFDPWKAEAANGTLERALTGQLEPGSLLLKLTKEGAWVQTVPVTAGLFCKFRTGVRQIGTGTAAVRLVWLDEAGKELGVSEAQPTTSPKEAWTTIDTTVRAPAKAISVSIQLTAKNQKTDRDQIWYDNVALYRIGVN